MAYYRVINSSSKSYSIPGKVIFEEQDKRNDVLNKNDIRDIEKQFSILESKLHARTAEHITLKQEFAKLNLNAIRLKHQLEELQRKYDTDIKSVKNNKKNIISKFFFIMHNGL